MNNTNSTDFRANFVLWNEFLQECKNTIEGQYDWETITLNGQHTQSEQDTIINQIFFKNASLPQIVYRQRFINTYN